MMDEFKQETMSLLKQQANEIKIMKKQMIIKDQQIRFLKQTIISLEDEKEQLNTQLVQLKAKMKAMLHQVTTYNSTVVSRVHHDNTSLTQQIQELRTNLQQNVNTIANLTNSIKHLQSINLQLNNDINKSNNLNQNNYQEIQQLKRKIQSIEGHNKKLLESQMKNNLKIEQLESKINNYVQQIQITTKKHQQYVNSSQIKIKALNDQMVSKEKYKKLEQNCQQIIKNNNLLKEKIDKLKKDINKKIYEYNSIKQKYLNIQINNQIILTKVQADIINLLQSINISKKVVQFQSKWSNKMQQIYQKNTQIVEQQQQLKDKLEKYEQIIMEIEKKLLIRQSRIQQLQIENNLIRNSYKEQCQSIESSYQGQIIQLSLKIKKQQRALHDLNIKQRQYQQLEKQFQALSQDFQALNNNSQRNIEQINKQNKKLVNQLSQMAKICQNSIHNKGVVNTIKYVLNDLLAVIYYLHLLMLRNRQKNRKLYLPFIDYYFQIHNKVQQKKKSIFKFRKAVIAVLMIVRIKSKIANKGNISVNRYAQIAIETRQKIGNIGNHLENILQIAIRQNTQIQDIIKGGKGMYRWNIHNFQRVLLHPKQDFNLIKALVEKQQQNLILIDQ